MPLPMDLMGCQRRLQSKSQKGLHAATRRDPAVPR